MRQYWNLFKYFIPNLRVFFFLLIFLQGCSFQSLSIRFGDTFITWWLEDLVELEPKQQELLEEIVHDSWTKFQCSGAKILIDDLQVIKKIYNRNGFDATLLTEVEGKWKEYRKAIFLPIKEQLANLVFSFSEDQLEQFEQSLNQRLVKRRKWVKLPDDEFIHEYQEHLVERFENFYGDLLQEQKEKLFAIRMSTKEEVKENIALREDLHEELIKKMKKGSNKEDFLSYLTKGLEDTSLMRSINFRPSFARWRSKRKSERKQVDEFITKEQRNHFVSKINSLINDFTQIIECEETDSD